MNANTRVMAVKILACVILTQYQRVTDGRADGHGDNSYNRALHDLLC